MNRTVAWDPGKQKNAHGHKCTYGRFVYSETIMPYGKSLKLYIAIIQGAEAKSKRYSPVAVVNSPVAGEQCCTHLILVVTSTRSLNLIRHSGERFDRLPQADIPQLVAPNKAKIPANAGSPLF